MNWNHLQVQIANIIRHHGGLGLDPEMAAYEIRQLLQLSGVPKTDDSVAIVFGRPNGKARAAAA
jgi:hypothetical protein